MRRPVVFGLRIFSLMIGTICVLGASATPTIMAPNANSFRQKTSQVAGSGSLQTTAAITQCVFGFGKMDGMGGVFVPRNEANAIVVLQMNMGDTRMYSWTKDLPPPGGANPAWEASAAMPPPMQMMLKPDYVARITAAQSGQAVPSKAETKDHTVMP